jgi:hypothetical protein
MDLPMVWCDLLYLFSLLWPCLLHCCLRLRLIDVSAMSTLWPRAGKVTVYVAVSHASVLGRWSAHAEVDDILQ